MCRRARAPPAASPGISLETKCICLCPQASGIRLPYGAPRASAAGAGADAGAGTGAAQGVTPPPPGGEDLENPGNAGGAPRPAPDGNARAVAHPNAMQQDEAAAWMGMADVDDRRGDVDEQGRPWYDSQYHNTTPSCLGSCIQFLLQGPYIILWVIVAHYLLYVPYKLLALCFYWIWPLTWVVKGLEERAKENRRLRSALVLYNTAMTLLLFFPFVCYSIVFVSPVTYIFCRHEAATELFYVWLVLALRWSDGWVIPSEQLLLSNRRYNARLMPIRVFHPNTGYILRREWVQTEEALPGLSKFGDVAIVDRFVNQMVLRGHMMSANSFYGFYNGEWGSIAERFVQFQLYRQRVKWSTSKWHNYVIFVMNSATCTLTSMRFASRFHALTRNERLFVIMTRVALNIFFAAILLEQGGSQALSLAFGAVSFLVVLVLTKAAAGTCLTGRGRLCEIYQTWASRFVLMFALLVTTLMGIIGPSVIFGNMRRRADRGEIEQPDGVGFLLSIVLNILTSEIVAWIFGLVLCFFAERRERKLVTETKGLEYDLKNVTRVYLEDFLDNFRWPEHIMQPPQPNRRAQFVDDVLEQLLGTVTV